MYEKTIEPVAIMHTGFGEKFGIPRQSGLVPEAAGQIVFEPKYQNPDALRGIEEFTHLWIIWGFSENKVEKFVICHDYIGISEWAERRWKTNTTTTAAYAAFMADYLGWVRFRKVAGHTGVKGNELADQLAKKALDI